MFAASIGNKKAVELLLEKGAIVNEKNNNGYTALIYAARSCNKEVVELLLNNYADIGIKNKYGYTVVDIAKKRNNYEVLFSLKKLLYIE